MTSLLQLPCSLFHAQHICTPQRRDSTCRVPTWQTDTWQTDTFRARHEVTHGPIWGKKPWRVQAPTLEDLLPERKECWRTSREDAQRAHSSRKAHALGVIAPHSVRKNEEKQSADSHRKKTLSLVTRWIQKATTLFSSSQTLETTSTRSYTGDRAQAEDDLVRDTIDPKRKTTSFATLITSCRIFATTSKGN